MAWIILNSMPVDKRIAQSYVARCTNKRSGDVTASAFCDHLSQRNALVHRPYHVAKDLTNENLFEKSDYKQYKKLRDAILSKQFEYSTKPVKGGNKPKLLAGKMGLMWQVRARA